MSEYPWPTSPTDFQTTVAIAANLREWMLKHGVTAVPLREAVLRLDALARDGVRVYQVDSEGSLRDLRNVAADYPRFADIVVNTGLQFWAYYAEMAKALNEITQLRAALAATETVD